MSDKVLRRSALVLFLPVREVLFSGSGIASNLLYLFLISGLLRALLAVLLARRVREIRKPRREISTQAFVMRITGFGAMMGLLYDFIGRPPGGDDEPRAG